MPTLPTPGGDDGTWGNILNSFLTVAHNADGSLLPSAITAAGAITSVNGQAPTGGSLTLAASNLSDMVVTNPTTNQVLTYNGSHWVNATPSSSSVTSVAGKTGAVSLVESDIANLTSDLSSKVIIAGDLSGAASNPTVAKLSGISLSGTPSAGQVLTATSGTAASWQTVNTGSGSSTLSGDTDVLIASPTNNQVLTYNSAAGKWENQTPSTGAVSSVFGRTGSVVAASGDYTVSQVTGAAPLASPSLTGTPTAPTATNGTNTTQLATTAFVQTAVTNNTVIDGVTISGTPSATQVLTATSSTAATWSTPASGGMTNPMTTLGDTLYGASGGAATRLAGNTTTTRKFFRQTGTGSVSAAPAWDTLVSGDLPAATTSAPGSIQLAGDLSGTATSPTVTTIGGHTPVTQSTTLSGDLSGTLPSPTVAKLNGITVWYPQHQPGLNGDLQYGGQLEYASFRWYDQSHDHPRRPYCRWNEWSPNQISGRDVRVCLNEYGQWECAGVGGGKQAFCERT